MLADLCAAHVVAAEHHRQMIEISDSLPLEDNGNDTAWDNQRAASEAEWGILEKILLCRPATRHEAEMKVGFLTEWAKEYLLDSQEFILLLQSILPEKEALQ
jgi:hypothetical protein